MSMDSVCPALARALAHRKDSFRRRLVALIRERAGGDAVAVYKRAGIDRRTYAKVIGSDSYRTSRRTAEALCLALGLDTAEADDLLRPLGFALGDHATDDLVVRYALASGIHDLKAVNRLLAAAGAEPFDLK